MILILILACAHLILLLLLLQVEQKQSSLIGVLLIVLNGFFFGYDSYFLVSSFL